MKIAIVVISIMAGLSGLMFGSCAVLAAQSSVRWEKNLEQKRMLKWEKRLWILEEQLLLCQLSV